MGDQNNNYTDTSFSLHQAHSYTLLLQVAATSFSFAVVHNNRLLILGQNCALHDLANPTQLNEILSAPYKSTVIGLPATGLTLVPMSLYRDEHVADFARFLDVKPNEKVLAQGLDYHNTIIYKTNAALVAAVEKFDLKNTVYTAKGWIKAIEKSSPPNNSLYLDIDNDVVQFLYFSMGSLRFYNTFDFKNDDELVYFTTFVAEELDLKPQQLTLVLSGDVNKGDKNFNRLADFYPKVELNRLQALELPGHIASHKVLSLATLALCVSSEAL